MDPQDLFIVRAVSRLPGFTPSHGFADRVMACVQLPEPRALVVLRGARAWAQEPRRALALAGGYAALAVLALGAVVPWLLANATSIGFATSWLSARVVEAAREAALGVAGWVVASGVYGFVESLSLSGGALAVLIGGLTVGYGACIVGLHQLLRAPRGKDVPVPLTH